MKGYQVTVDYTNLQGGFTLSCVISGHLAKRYYQGYTIKEALKLFSADVLGGVSCYA